MLRFLCYLLFKNLHMTPTAVVIQITTKATYSLLSPRQVHSKGSPGDVGSDESAVLRTALSSTLGYDESYFGSMACDDARRRRAPLSSSASVSFDLDVPASEVDDAESEDHCEFVDVHRVLVG